LSILTPDNTTNSEPERCWVCTKCETLFSSDGESSLSYNGMSDFPLDKCPVCGTIREDNKMTNIIGAYGGAGQPRWDAEVEYKSLKLEINSPFKVEIVEK